MFTRKTLDYFRFVRAVANRKSLAAPVSCASISSSSKILPLMMLVMMLVMMLMLLVSSSLGRALPSFVIRPYSNVVQHARASINPCDERELDLRGYKIPMIENLGVRTR